MVLLVCMGTAQDAPRYTTHKLLDLHTMSWDTVTQYGPKSSQCACRYRYIRRLNNQ